MARKVADPCRNCGAELAPGSAFCTLCGAAVANRAATPAPSSVPLGTTGAGTPGVDASSTAPAQTVPGVIPVGALHPGPLVPPVHVGVDPRLAAGSALVPGGAGRRLVARIIDGVLPAVLLGVAFAIGLPMMSVSTSDGYQTFNFMWLTVFVSVAALLSLAYSVWLWVWEARTGKTPGNIMMGLRTTNMAGEPAGLLAIFLRSLIIYLGSIVAYIGTILVVISNTWDSNGKRQGWHDKVANTLVFNVKTGRDPLETGGIAGREAFAPAAMPAISQVNSPLPVRPGPAPEAGVPVRPSWQAPQAPQAPGPITGVPFSAPSQPAPAAGLHNPAQYTPSSTGFAPPPSGFGATPADAPNQASLAAQEQALGETRVRPVSTGNDVRLTFDDGHTEDISTVALLGRNPAGYDGEMIERLISVHDSSRSVSKTHLHLQAAAEGLWVTDRNSTNGSAITTADGHTSPLPGGTPTLAEHGARVRFGDRSFLVARA